MWRTRSDVSERPWKNPNIITGQSDTAESCFHYSLHRHKVKYMSYVPYSLYVWGCHSVDLPYSARGSSFPHFHVRSLLPFTCFFLSSRKHLFLTLYSNSTLSHSSHFMLAMKLAYSLEYRRYEDNSY